MTHSSCLYYVLDRLTEDVGYIRARLSGRIKNLHAQHIDREGNLSHFVPHKALDSAWQILDGFVAWVNNVRANRFPTHPLAPQRGSGWVLFNFCRRRFERLDCDERLMYAATVGGV